MDAQWDIIVASYDAFVDADAAWVSAIDGNGDPVAAGKHAREAFCKLRTVAKSTGKRLPDFPVKPCSP
jgi:hypothetical protein